MLLNLSTREIERLYKLNQDKDTIEGLKKHFMNVFIGDKLNSENKAAAYIALKNLETAFSDLARIQPKETITSKNENMV